MSNRFEVLGHEERTEGTEESEEETETASRGKNQGKHKRRAVKRAAERAVQQAAQAKRGRVEYGFSADFRPRRRQFRTENDESVQNRFVWVADDSYSSSIVLTPEMFPVLK
jgi:hypothetical protein